MFYKSGNFRFRIPSCHIIGVPDVPGQWLSLPVPPVRQPKQIYSFPYPRVGKPLGQKYKGFFHSGIPEKEQEVDHIVSIEVIETIMSGIIVQFRTKIKMVARFLDHGVINGKKYGLIFQRF